MITDVYHGIVDSMKLAQLFPKEGFPLLADLCKIADFPALFFLTGSIADGEESPNDIDLFVTQQTDCRKFLERIGFIAVSPREVGYEDLYISMILRKAYVGMHVDVQVIRPNYLYEKIGLMRDFHMLAKVIKMTKEEKKVLLQTISKGSFQYVIRSAY